MPNVKATFTADISQFRASLAQATTAVTAFDRTTGQVNAQLKRFGNEFSGARIQRDALTIAKAVSDIGGVTKLTDAELKKVSGTLTEAIAKWQRLGQEAPESIKSLASAVDSMQKASASLNGADLSPERVTRGFGLLQGAVAGVAAAITTQGLSSLKQFAADIVQTAGDVSDLADKTGLTTNQVQRFGFAASQTGSSVDAIANAVTQLSDRLVEGKAGTVNAVQALGLSLKDLQQQNPGQAFEAIASAIRDVPDPMQQTQIAMELFGRSGAEILPAIKQGIAELGDEAERLGLVMDASAVQALDNFGDKWDQMTLRAKASAASVLGDTLRIIEALNEVGRAAANALPRETRESPFGRLVGAGASGGLSALGLYASGARLANDLMPFGMAGEELTVPNGRPLPIGAPARGLSSTELRAAEQQTDAAIRRLEESLRKGEEAARKMAEALDKLTGRDVIQRATTLATQIEKVGITNVLPSSMPTFVEQLQAGLERATALGPKFAQSARQIEAALAQAVNSPAYREFFQRSLTNPTIGLGQRSNLSAITGTALQTAITGGLPASTVPDLFDTFAAARVSRSIAGFVPDLQNGVKATKDWRIELQGVAQAFAQLAQVGGRSLDGLNRTMGAVFTSASAGVELVKSLSGVLKGLTNEKGEMTGAGRALGAGLAGFSVGAQMGSLFESRRNATLAGAGTGAAAGFMVGGPLGAGVGAIIGGISAAITSGAMAAAKNDAKDVQMEQLVAQFGSLEELLDTAGRVGLDQEGFLRKFYGDPESFAKGVSELNAALTRERKEVESLGKALDAAAKAQGILSRADMERLTSLRPGGPGDEVRQQFLEGQTGQLVGGLTSFLQNGQLSPESVGSAGVALGQAFTLMRQQGLSVKQILDALGPALDAFKQRAVDAGLGSTEQFDNLSRMLDTLRGPLGGVIDGALGAGAALAALTNTGSINQDMFGGLAKAISDAYFALERDGKGGVDAVMLLQGPLQNIWQLMEDFGLQVDADTQKLIDFALEAGLIGENFRPATEQMAKAVGELITKIDQLITRIGQIPGINIPVTYTPGEPPSVDPANPNPAPNPTPPNGGDYTTALATGGVVTRPTRALIGEAGPEAVIPLSKLRASGQRAITIVNVTQLDGREVARSVNRYQGEERRLVGVA